MRCLLKSAPLFAMIIAVVGCSNGEIQSQPQEPTDANGPEKVITDYGAVGDGLTDCAPIINKLIREMPLSGGSIVIPEGEFILDNPIVIDRSFVTIRGLNPGMRSNVDVPPGSLKGPGGGSKLLLRGAEYGIHVPTRANVGDMINRISGVEVRDLLISGGPTRHGTGIFVAQDNDRSHISNIICINLDCGIRVQAADAMMICDSWVCEVGTGIEMNLGIQNMIANCQLGAQPDGITCLLRDQTNFVFTGNQVYPDGKANLVLEGCDLVGITANNFKSFYPDMISIRGDNNLVSGNVFWLESNPAQLAHHSADHGIIRVDGNANLLDSNTITCEWRGEVRDPVTIRILGGTRNRFSNILVTDQRGDRVFRINETTEVFYCVPPEKIEIEGDPSLVNIKY